MRDSSHFAFGAYLRTLRQRRGLSLEAVAAHSKRLPVAVSAPYLSRCERGLRLPGISRLISISRILHVPTQALIDKLAIETELQRMELKAAPDERPDRLMRRVRESVRRGRFWEAYHLSRTLEQRLASSADSIAVQIPDGLTEATIYSAWSAARLGRIDLCVYELCHVHQQAAGQWRQRASVMEALSLALLHQGNLVEAKELADDLDTEAAERQDPTRLAAAAMRKAKIAKCIDPSSGLARYLAVDKALRAPGVTAVAESRIGPYVLAGMGECYRESGRSQAARHATIAFMERALQAHDTHAVNVARIQLGHVENDRGAERSAYRLWSQAAEATEACNNRPLEFRAQYLLLELAERRAQAGEVERIRSRLIDLYPWAIEGEREYEAFRRREAAPRADRHSRGS